MLICDQGAAASVRILDASGAASNVGVLQAQVGSGGFGTIAGTPRPCEAQRGHDEALAPSEGTLALCRPTVRVFLSAGE